MQPHSKTVRASAPGAWTQERIETLSADEIESLRANAATLGKEEIVARCEAALRERPKRARAQGGKSTSARSGRHLISRAKALEARGVWLQDPRCSWSGVRKLDGGVVMTLWASGIESAGGACSYLLWAPNVDGARPWSDAPAGKERLEHCRLALKNGQAEGLLVYGERLDGYIPEDKARSIYGVDPETVVHFRVEQRGNEYWATWGKKAAL